jgi:hypothetical protein
LKPQRGPGARRQIGKLFLSWLSKRLLSSLTLG